MIELPEAVVISQQIVKTLTGRCIERAVANASPHKFAWYTGDPANYQDLLAGKTIRGAGASGNHIEIQADDWTLVISTPIKYHSGSKKPPQKHQLLLEFSDKTAITCTVQMWGAMLCLPPSGEGANPEYYISKERPSPLSEAFDRAYFDSLIDSTNRNLSAKEFLATKQRIPGLGNGVLQDILWTARIHPRSKLSDLDEMGINAMYQALRHVLTEMTAQGGRDTERDLFDRPGGYRTILSKNTVCKPCPACGSIIQKESYLGGAIYFCPECQM
jgi:formamidopyrimidine-DNA glycosylase